MAGFALGAVGAAVGGSFGFASLGWIVGSTIGNFLFAKKPAPLVSEGPRMNDLRVQASTWGASIPLLFGDARIAGNVIDTSGIRETRHENRQEAGGKGGGGGQSVTTISYTYDVDLAIMVGLGPITGIEKAWGNGRLFYDVGSGASLETIIASNANSAGMRVYLGTTTQLVDPTLEALHGVGLTPAYRGRAYVMLVGFQLADYGNAIPNFTFKVIAAGSIASLQAPSTYTVSIPGAAANDARYNEAVAIFGTGPGGVLGIWSPVNGLLIGTVDYNATGIRGFTCSSLDFAGFAPAGNGAMFTLAFCALNGSGLVAIIKVDENGSPIAVWWAGISSFPLGNGQLAYGGDGWLYYANTTTGEVFAFPDSAAQLINPAAPVTTHRILIGGSGVHGLTSCVGKFNQGAGRVGFLGHNATEWVVCFPQAERLNAFSLGIPIATSVNSTSCVVFDHLGNPWVAWEVSTPSTHGEINQLDPNSGTVVRTIVLPNGTLGSTATRFFFSNDGYLYTYGGSIWTKRDYLTGEALHTSVTVANVVNVFPTPWANVLQQSDGGNTQVALRILEPLPRLTLTASTTLDEVVTRICELAGLDASDIDVSELTDPVDGYQVARVGTARSAIEPLQKAYFFDAVESDDVIKFVKRGGASAVTIPFDDLVEDGQEDPLTLTRTQEQELPRQITLNFINKSGDYLPGSEYARRLVTRSDSDILEELPIALAPAAAAQIAEKLLYDAYTGRNGCRFATTRKYAKFEPTDVVTVTGVDGSTYPVHVRRKTDRGEVIRWEGVLADAPVYTSTKPGTTVQAVAPGVAFAGPTRLEFLDIPIIRDVDNDAGFYAALSGYSSSWRGGVLHGSPDGVNYSELGSVLNSAVVGTAASTLGTFAGGNVFDEGNTVDVTLDSGTLQSLSRADVLNEQNAALLGGEIIQFRTATLQSGTTWRLSGLLRGRRGTDAAISTHATGERFVLLQLAGMLRPALALGDLNLLRYYKAQSFGEPLGSSVTRSFTATGGGLKPLAPARLRGFRHYPSSNDWSFKWIRRGRIAANWLPSVDVPLGETTEEYSVDIINQSTGAVVRTLTTVTTAEATYTSAQQTTDFGGAQTTVKARVYQLSASVGRGFPTEGTF